MGDSKCNLKQKVQEVYGNVAKTKVPWTTSAISDKINLKEYSNLLGYSKDELDGIPVHSNMGLGCGNPTSFANLKEGEVVVDLGSGAGIDSFLASKLVGPNGRILSVDMTPEMIDLLKENVVQGGYTNIECYLGEIEKLPLTDNIADVVISNGVINLCINKQKIFEEAARILKPGGRVAISDVIAIDDIPDELKKNIKCYAGCISGSIKVDELHNMMKKAGFKDIQVNVKRESREYISTWEPAAKAEDYVSSADITAVKI